MWCLLYAILIASNGVVGRAENFTQPRWLTDYMPDLLQSVEYRSDTERACTKHGHLYQQHLKNQTLWAVAMHDASALHFDGLTTGGMYHFGAFDSCMNINLPDFELAGRYCLVHMEFKPRIDHSHGNYTASSVINPLSSVWEMFQKSNDPRVANKDVLKFALCIPSGCKPTDLQNILDEQVAPVLESEGLTVALSVTDTMCITAADVTKLDIPGLIYLSVIGSLTCAVLIVSFIHGHGFDPEGRKRFSQHWLSSFSAINAGVRLMRADGLPELHFTSGMKVLSMFLIIFGHRYLSLLYAPTVNVLDIEKKYGDFLETVLFNGPIIVNTFLLISGFFTYLKVLKEIEKGRPINVFLHTYFRWIRVTSVYLVAILFSALIMPHFITGPGWKLEGLWRTNSCRRNWWTHILYINNYYRADEECLLPGWYLAVDMQMFVIATTLGYVVSKKRILEIPLFTSLFIISVAVPAVVTYFAGYGPIIRFYLNYLPHYWREPDYVESYTKTHMRAAPYIMGMITAKIYFKLKAKKFQFSSCALRIMALICIVLSTGVLFSAWPFFQYELNPSRLTNALYSSFSKVLWSLGMCMIILGQSSGGYGFAVGGVLSHKIYAPFNKLTLGALVIHPLVQYQIVQRTRVPITINASIIAWSTAGDIAMSYFLAIFLFFIVEAPISSLNNHLLRKLFIKPK